MLTRSFVSFLAILTVCLSGCSTVVFKQPVGTPIQDQDHLNKLGGAWSAGPAEPVTMIQPLKDGKIAIGVTSWDHKEGKFTVQQFAGVVTELDGAHYINVNNPDEEDAKNDYFVMRVTHADNHKSMVAYAPNFKAFKNAVERGALAGEISDGGSTSVTLTGSKDQIDSYLKTTMAGQQFELDNPIIVHLVGEVDD